MEILKSTNLFHYHTTTLPHFPQVFFTTQIAYFPFFSARAFIIFRAVQKNLMTEKMLQFIWKNRYFNQQGLELITGEPVTIDYPGELNTHQGPDFINARVRINGNYWIGSVELHLFSSGWVKHSHSEDDNYRNVMLHVVWKQ